MFTKEFCSQITICFIIFFVCKGAKSENVYGAEMFSIKIEPRMFNWTFQGIKTNMK